MPEPATDHSHSVWWQFADLFDRYGVTFMITVCVVVGAIFVLRVFLKHMAAKLEAQRLKQSRLDELEIERRELDIQRLRGEAPPVATAPTPPTDSVPAYTSFNFSDHPFFHEANNVIALADHLWLGDAAKSLVARDIIIVSGKTFVSGLNTLIERVKHRGGFDNFFSTSADFASKIDRFYVWLRESTERRLKDGGLPSLIVVKYSRATERHINIMRKMFAHAATTDNLSMEIRFWFIMNSFLAGILNLQEKVTGIIKELNGELNGIEYKGVVFGDGGDQSLVDDIVAEENRRGTGHGSGFRSALRDESDDEHEVAEDYSDADTAEAYPIGDDSNDFFFMETLAEFRDEGKSYPTIDDFDRILGADPGRQPTRPIRRDQ